MSNPKEEPVQKVEDLEEAEVPTHRVRFLIIDPNQFLSIFTKGLVLAKRVRVLKGVPEDAEVVRMTVDHVRGGIILVVRSDEYEEIPINKMPEVQYIEMDLGNKNATKKGAKH